MSPIKKNKKTIRSYIRSKSKRRKSQVFLIGAIIATIYVIIIATTLNQLQVQPVDDAQEEVWTLSHAYKNIKQELRTAMIILLANYTTNDADNSHLQQIFEQHTLIPIERYCEQHGISARLRLIQPLTILNDTYITDGSLKAYINVSTTIHITLQTEHAKIEDERVLMISYMADIRTIEPIFQVDLYTIINQNDKTPKDTATVHLINLDSQEQIIANTFHNGTYYANPSIIIDKIEIQFETGILFVIFLSNN